MEKDKRKEDSVQLRVEYLKMKSALIDKNTGLSSFHLYFDEVRSLLDRRRYIGIVHLEISNLNIVESLYGWQVFEQILKKVSAQLNALRGKTFSEKTILAMNGAYGDKFVLFIPETLDGQEITPESLLDLTDRMSEKLSGEFSSTEYATMAARLGFNMGCSILQESPYYRLERLIYQGIEDARSTPLRKEERRIAALSTELKTIISNEDIQTVFQDIIDLESMGVFGYEAFSRGPKDSAFEKPGMMFAISQRIGISADLDRVCRNTALKNASGIAPGVKLFINSLPISISDTDWRSGGIDEMLWKLGMKAEDIIIEIPEKYYAADSSAFKKDIQFLKEKGIGIAIDDIGTGYSSLQTITESKPEYLKIDASLIRDIDRNLIKQELIGSLIHIARNIGASVIAEGVETDGELDVIRKAGVKYAQGYYFSYPSRGVQTLSKKLLNDH